MNLEEAIDLACKVQPSSERPLSEAEERSVATTLPFHGTKPPNRSIEQEKGRHRLAAYLYCTGMAQGQIARHLGVTDATMSQWVRQPWFQEFVRNEMALVGRDSVQQIIKGEALASVLTLVIMRDNEQCPPAVRQKCCSELLDRAYGKAPAVVAHHNVDRVPEDINAVGAELRRMLDDQTLMQSLQASQS